jgi:hypothetical protein
MRVQYRLPVGMPLCRPLGDGLWEVRSDLASNRIARVKTQKTSESDLALARKRKRKFEQ